MKLNQILAAAGLVFAAVAANAGITVSPSGQSDMFVAVWANGANGGAAKSYVLDLGVDSYAFVATDYNASGAGLTTVLGSSNWTAFTSAVDMSTAKWAVIGIDSNIGYGVVTTGNKTAAQLQGTLSQDNAASGPNQVQGFLSYSNAAAGASLDNVGTSGSLAYFQNSQLDTLNLQFWNLGSNVGATTQVVNTLADNDPASITYLTTAKLSQVGSSYQLEIGNTSVVTAVPEPTGYALALAGFGVLGFIARRRKA